MLKTGAFARFRARSTPEKSELFVEVYSAGGGPALASITDSHAAAPLAVTNDRRVFIGAEDGSVSVWSP